MTGLSDQLLMLAPSAILVDRPQRQRSVISTKNLVDSIHARGIINPLVVEPLNPGVNDNGGQPVGAQYSHRLVAGERRLAAATELRLAVVPCRLWTNLDPTEAQIIELEENLKRQDLTWQDLTKGVARIHGLLVERAAAEGRSQTLEATGETIGMVKSAVSMYLRLSREFHDPKILGCTRSREAYNIILRREAREHGNQVQEILDELDGVLDGGQEANDNDDGSDVGDGLGADVAGGTAVASLPVHTQEAKPAATVVLRSAAPRLAPPADVTKSILHESFLQWAPRYSGPKFNLIHCDFPYGLDVFAGPQMQASGHQYADGAKDYFALLECFCQNLERFASQSAHLMFWYSEKHGDATRKVFREAAPSWVFQPFPLVWVKSDNAGIAASSMYGPRHIYETCMMATRGRRPIVKIKGDAYSAPRDPKLHVSAKPIPVLRHFFEMLVDEHTQVFDPTCGSGSALMAGELQGARTVLGLEIDEVQCGLARQALRAQRSMRTIG